MKILFASQNPGKIAEVRQILSHPNLEIVNPPNDLDVAETGDTFEANAHIKARYWAGKTGLVSLADDSGLCIDALAGEPGVYSARIGRSDQEKIQKILDRMKNVENRQARFICTLCLYNPDNNEVTFFTGTVEGTITHKPIGTNGFGYDPIFYSTELGKTFGEASIEEKNTISHRQRALKQLANSSCWI